MTAAHSAVRGDDLILNLSVPNICFRKKVLNFKGKIKSRTIESPLRLTLLPLSVSLSYQERLSEFARILSTQNMKKNIKREKKTLA